MNNHDIKSAFDFYRRFICNAELSDLLEKRGFHVAGCVSAVVLELFGSILTGDNGKSGYGSDLNGHEVKSAIIGSSFEYQYHLNGGMAKIKEDMAVSHVFISYSKNYRDVNVRVLGGADLEKKFASWIPGLQKNYSGKNRKQRYRKSISYGFVQKKGVLVMQIRGSELVVL